MNKPAPDEVRESQPTNTDQPSRSQRSRARSRRRKSAHQAKKAGPVHKAASYQPAQESDGGHLPAFLLRPVSVKEIGRASCRGREKVSGAGEEMVRA